MFCHDDAAATLTLISFSLYAILSAIVYFFTPAAAMPRLRFQLFFATRRCRRHFNAACHFRHCLPRHYADIVFRRARYYAFLRYATRCHYCHAMLPPC
jgi:hypothetical protein